jgi:Glyoxalase-like domain
MSVGFQVTFDAANTEQLARFWAAVLGYREMPPPDGFDSWDSFADSVGIPSDERDSLFAIVDPDGVRPRLLFQKVPEGKAAKNRVHLDVNVAVGITAADERKAAVAKKVEELRTLGASEEQTFDEPTGYWTVMRDPEGNEFCVQ